MRQLRKIIEDILDDLNKSSSDFYTIESFCDDWCLIIKKNNSECIKIFGYTFDLNDSVTCEICRDKAICSEILLKNNIPSVYHKVFYKDNNFEDIALYCEKIKYPVVVKKNDGGCGNYIFYTKNKEELKDNVQKIFIMDKILSIAKYEEIIDEYRFLMLNGELKLCYKKKRNHIVGDGVSTIKELLMNKECNIPVNFNENIILKKGEIFIINWQHNLSHGAEPEIVNDVDPEMLKIAKETVKVLNLKVGCVDIIINNSFEKKVLEVNSGLMMDNFSQCKKRDFDYYDIAKNIYKKVILESFKNITK